MGASVGEQLPACQYERRFVIVHSSESLCVDILWHDGNSGAARVYRERSLRTWEEEGPQHASGAESDSDLELLYGSDSDDPMNGKIESVEWTQGTKQRLRVDDALGILKEKYGKPGTCRQETNEDARLGFNFRGTDCTWVLPWGRIHFTGTTLPTEADYINVIAQTNRYIQQAAEQTKSDAQKLKNIF